MTYDEIIYNTAVSDGMPPTLATMIVAQARHETGNYTSHFFTVGHNAFGYSYYPGSKWQLIAPGPIADNGKPIAQYNNLQNSVHELTSWIKRRQSEKIFPADLRTIQTPDQYARYLKAADYYGASLESYANALAAWLQQLGNMPLANEGSLLIIIIALGLFAFRKRLGL